MVVSQPGNESGRIIPKEGVGSSELRPEINRVVYRWEAIYGNDRVIEKVELVERRYRVDQWLGVDITGMTRQKKPESSFLQCLILGRLSLVQAVQCADKTVLEKVAHLRSRIQEPESRSQEGEEGYSDCVRARSSARAFRELHQPLNNPS